MKHTYSLRTKSKKLNSGFTLLELSIVLVIIGLIAGGITIGGDMIRAAELRAIMTEHQQYMTSVTTFQNKYQALPGDMKNATAFWGEAHATPADCITTVSTGKETCNGDGDRKVESSSAASNEIFRFWQHLSNAGMLEGSFNGVTGSGGNYHSELNKNIPEAAITGTGWSIRNWGTYGGSSTWFAGSYNNTFSFGTTTTNSVTFGAALTPEEAWSIDTKIDDGNPAKGKIFASKWDDCTNATGNTDYTSEYSLNTSSVECGLNFLDQF